MMRSYWPAIIVSLMGHSVLVWLVVWGWQASSKPALVKPPAYVKATLVSLEQKAKPKPIPKKQPAPPKVNNEKKRLEEKKKQEQKKLAEQKKRQQAQAKKAAQERKNQLAKKQAEEKKKAEEKRKQQEQERLAKLEQEEKDRRKEELARELAAEQTRLREEQQAAADADLIQSYNSIINDRVSQNWSRPPSARNGMSVVLRIQLVPTGNVISVETLTSSGDSAFDRSAERAVKKAERFPELKDMPARVFERYYRNFNLKFIPEDLRQ